MDSIKMTTEQQLPKGWKIERLGDVLQIQNGYAFKSIEFIKENPENIHIPLIRQSQLVGNIVDVSNCVFLNRKYLIDKQNYIVNKGDILIGMSGSIGKVSFYEEDYPALLNQRVGKLNLYDNDTFQKDFFAYLLISLESSIIQIAKGMGVQNISSKDIEQLKIPIPPLETQQAIVNKIESLFNEIDEGIGRLKTAAQQIQQYRQSLLKNAFNGELTKEWRSKHADTLPSENELLAQIQTTREQHHAQQLADWQTAVSQWEQNGKEGKKPSKPKAPTQAVKFEENVTDLPRGWGVVKLENIADIGSGMSVSASRKLENPITVNYLRVGNVQRGYLDLKEIKEMQIEAENFDKYSLRLGDVLFNEGGDRDKLGRGWIWENQIPNCITQNHVFRASLFLKLITHSKYISYLGNSRYGQSYFEKTGKQTTNLASINKTVLSNFPVKLPSFAEQTQIVAILESKLTACDQLADELAKQLKQAEMLKQAVLKAAFSGGLLDK